MIKLSYRDVISYIGQEVNVPNGIPYTSNPSAPWNSQEMVSYQGRAQTSNCCPNCKSINLLTNNEKGIGYCSDCQGRFSLLDRQEGNSFTSRAIPRGTGLLNLDQGSNSVPEAHSTNEYGSGSASKSWGT